MVSQAITLQLTPEARLDVIDVNQRISEEGSELLSSYPRVLYYSYHTTAGYLEQSLCERFNHSRDSLYDFLQSFRRLFPPGADYHHDQLHLRQELSDEQRRWEPRNADSHLAFIGAGLTSCVTYVNYPGAPVYFIDLDGINGPLRRRRQTTVVGYSREIVAIRRYFSIPVSRHPVDSVNLKDPRLGIWEELEEMVRRCGVCKGRIDVELLPWERNAGLTVNEYETLLMKHDLAEVLRNPFRFMAEKGRHILNDPAAVPGKALNYAKYDLVQVLNTLVDRMGLGESWIERILNKFLAVPAQRFLSMKRSVSFPVCDQQQAGKVAIIEGTYQSPILVQWKHPETQIRKIRASLVCLE